MVGKHSLNLNHETLVAVFTSPYFIAIPVAVFFIFLLPDVDKYTVKLVKSAVCNKSNSIVTWHDLDSDGYSEKIILFDDANGDATLKLETAESGLAGWHPFKGKYFNDAPLVADFNHDTLCEVYFLSTLNDSLFLNVLDPVAETGFIGSSVFLTRVGFVNDKKDFVARYQYVCDLQGDGYDEVFISVLAGESLLPRCTFAYDRIMDTIYRTPPIGANMQYYPCNLDDDPFPEFYTCSSSLDNMKDRDYLTYHDSAAWFVVLDHDLRFLFEPVEFPGYKVKIESLPLKYHDSIYLLVLYDYYHKQADSTNLSLYNLRGELMKRKPLDKPDQFFYYTLRLSAGPLAEEAIVKDEKGIFYRTDTTLSLIAIRKLCEGITNYPEYFDLDADGKKEYVFTLTDFESLIITRNDFSDPTKFNVPFSKDRAWISVLIRGDEWPLLSVQKGEREMRYSYKRNKSYCLKFPSWLLIYLLVLGFIHTLYRFRQIQENKRKAIENRLAELQLIAINRHLDDHFTFNAINLVTSLIYKEEKDKAHHVLTSLSRLIRHLLNDPGTSHTTLGQEIEFTENYCSIQEYRFKDRFSYQISVEEGVDLNLKIPKLLVQLYAENSVKHGLKHQETDGKLDIEMKKTEKGICIRIADNGIGRAKAQERGEPGTGQSLENMEQVFALFKKMYKTSIRQTINDLFDNAGSPAGTEVLLNIEKS